MPFDESPLSASELIAAANGGSTAQVEEILQRPQDPNAPVSHGLSQETPLGHAAHRGHGEVVRLLLEASADTETVGGVRMETPLLSASSRGHEEVARL